MKKFIGFIKEMWLYNSDKIFKGVVSFITLGWVLYIANIVSDSSAGMLGRFFVISWAVVLSFVWLLKKSKQE